MLNNLSHSMKRLVTFFMNFQEPFNLRLLIFFCCAPSSGVSNDGVPMLKGDSMRSGPSNRPQQVQASHLKEAASIEELDVVDDDEDFEGVRNNSVLILFCVSLPKMFIAGSSDKGMP